MPSSSASRSNGPGRETGVFGAPICPNALGTVREDYSPDGEAWKHFSHDHARSRAYRWNEDGLGGLCDEQQRLCFALALWNGRDPILKERAFGLTGNEGNRGEDVKEYYFYLDATPSHSWLRYLYKYPQAAYPYEHLVAENRRRGRGDAPFNLLDTGVFDEDRYWDVEVSYAKASPTKSTCGYRRTIAGRKPRQFICCRACGSATRGPGTRVKKNRRSELFPCRPAPPGRSAPITRPSALTTSTDAIPPSRFSRNDQRRAAMGRVQCRSLCKGRVP